MFHTPNRLMLSPSELGWLEYATARGLRAYWKLDDASSSTSANSIIEELGNITNDWNEESTSGTETWRQTAIDSVTSYSLKTGSTYISLGSWADTGDNASVEWWEDFNTNATYFRSGDGVWSASGEDIAKPRAFVRGKHNGGASEIRMALAYPSTVTSSTITDVTTTTPVHICITQEKESSVWRYKFYINGVVKWSTTKTGKVLTADATYTARHFNIMGMSGNPDCQYYLSYVAYYNQTLTLAQVNALMDKSTL